VHWRQIGNVIDRPAQLDFDGLGISRGVFAPSIAFHDGVFYVLNTPSTPAATSSPPRRIRPGRGPIRSG
jgi:beta-xylosidase